MNNNRNNFNDRDFDRMTRKFYENYYGDPGIRAIREDQRRQQEALIRKMDAERNEGSGSGLFTAAVCVSLVIIYTILQLLGVVS